MTDLERTKAALAEDKGYRRGFDQGVAALAYALGIPSEQLQRSAFKQRVKNFRYRRLRSADGLWQATPAERQELLGIVMELINA